MSSSNHIFFLFCSVLLISELIPNVSEVVVIKYKRTEQSDGLDERIPKG